MADEPDPRLDATLRRAIREDADSVPFTLRASALEDRLAARVRARRRRNMLLVAAAAVVAVGIGGAALSLGRFEAEVAQSPSTPPASSTTAPQDPTLAGLASFEELQGLPSAPESVLARGEGNGGTTVVGDIAGGVELRLAVACSGGEILVRQGVEGPSSTVTCRPEGTTVSVGVPSSSSPVAQVSVIAPAGIAWRVVAGTGEAKPTPQAGCAPINSLSQYRQVNLTNTFNDQAYGIGFVTWTGTTDPPAGPETWRETDPFVFEGVENATTWRMTVEPHCVVRWEVQYAEAGAVEVALAAGRAPDAVTIASDAAGPAETFEFELPGRGQYVVRILTTWLTGDGSTVTDVRLYRIQTNALANAPIEPHPSPAVACFEPGPAAVTAPGLSLYRDGMRVGDGQVVTSSWNRSPAPGTDAVPERALDLPDGVGLELRIEGDACANLWSIRYGPVPISMDMFDRTSLILAQQGNPSLDPSFARENHIPLATLPAGEWIVEALVMYFPVEATADEFPGGGSRTWFRVRVGG